MIYPLMSTNERFLGTEEVALQLGMGPEWVRRQVEAGRLRARICTIGGRTDLPDHASLDRRVPRQVFHRRTWRWRSR
jgi:hypothetical protein